MKKLTTAALVITALSAFGAFAEEKAKPADAKAAAPAASFTMTALKDAKWMPMDPKNPQGPQIAVLWGDPSKGAATMFFKLPAGGKSGVHAHSHDYTAVVLQGGHAHGNTEADANKPLAVGTAWVQAGKAMHFDACIGKEDCVTLIHTAGAMDYLPQAAAAPAAKK